MLIWEVYKQQSVNDKDWKQGVVPITNINQDYKIILEGTVGTSNSGETFYGDIA